MRTLQPVLWGKGIFLQPQHLQSQERFLESLIEFRIQALSVMPYGFVSIKTAISGRTLRIISASGLMPDGLPFDIPASDKPATGSLEIAIDHKMPGDRGRLDILLAIPESHPGQPSVSLDGTSPSARYTAYIEKDVRDETGGEHPKQIQLARKSFRLLAETQTEALQGCSAMRIARLVKQGDTFRVDEKAPPPLLKLHACKYLSESCRGLVNRLSRRTAELAKKRVPRHAAREITALDSSEFWLSHTLNTSIPVLRELCARGDEPEADGFDADKAPFNGVHPVHVYRELSSMAGSLLTFQGNEDEIPPYNHDEPGDCLGKLMRLILNLTDGAIPRTYQSQVLLPQTEPNRYLARVPDDWFRSKAVWYLAVTSSLSDDEWNALLPLLGRTTKVAAASDLPGLVTTATPGVEFSFESTPAALPTRTARHLQLSATGTYWDAVERSRTIAVYIPQEAKPLRLELIVCLPEDGGN